MNITEEILTERQKRCIPDVSFELIPIKNLVSNQDYQRPLSESHIRKALEEFDVYQINPVKVSRRDGINYVFDGQHTIEIVASESGSRETPVWCMIYDDLKYTEEEFITWGKENGPAIQLTVESFLRRGREPEQGYKFCASLQGLARKYSGARLEAACEKLLECTSNPDIRTLSSMLRNGQDKIRKPKEEKGQKHSSTGHTRGADYYRNLKGGASK